MCLFCQLTVQAYDGGVPVLKAPRLASVVITVLQNLNKPRFVDSTCNRAVNTNLAVGSNIMTVQASDEDPVSLLRQIKQKHLTILFFGTTGSWSVCSNLNS